MFPTLEMSEIITKWRDTLVNNPDINGFCQNNYAKHPKLFIGLDQSSPPQDGDCPYILIHPGCKTEGACKYLYRYTILVDWGVYNETKEQEENLTELPGLYECDDLGQIIMRVLSDSNPSIPLSKVNYHMQLADYFPRFTGEMEIRLYYVSALKENLSY